MTATRQVNVGVPDETAVLVELAEALRRVSLGDLKVRLPHSTAEIIVIEGYDGPQP